MCWAGGSTPRLVSHKARTNLLGHLVARVLGSLNSTRALYVSIEAATTPLTNPSQSAEARHLAA